MAKAKNKQDLKAKNRQRWVDAASALWDLASNKRNPNAIRILAEMIGLGEIASLLLRKHNGDTTVDAEAVRKIAGAIELDQNKRR